MNFLNFRRGQFDQFDNNFNSNWGENYYPCTSEGWGEQSQDFGRDNLSTQNFGRGDMGNSNCGRKCHGEHGFGKDEEVFEGKFFCTRKTNKPNRPCGRPCNRPCYDEIENDGCGWDRPRPNCGHGNRPCNCHHNCNGSNQNTNDALLFLSGYFIAKRCR